MMRALVVDDVIENQQMLREILEEVGFRIDVASSITEAVTSATSEAFDVILMDLAIPRHPFEKELVFGGLEASEEIQRILGDRTPPILAVTANGMRDIRNRVLEAGLCDIIEKSSNFSQRVRQKLSQFLDASSLAEASASEAPRLVTSVPLPRSQSIGNAMAARDHEFPPPGNQVRPQARPLDTGPVTVAPRSAPEPFASDDKRSQIAPTKIDTSSDSSSVDPSGEPVRTNESTFHPATQPSKEPQSPASLPLESLRDRLLVHVRSAEGAFRRYEIEIQELDLCPQHREIVNRLSMLFASMIGRLGDRNDGPKPGESYAHWIANMMTALDYRVQKLRELDDSQFYSRWRDLIEETHDELRTALTLAKSSDTPSEQKGGVKDSATRPLSSLTATSQRGDDQPLSDLLEPVPSPIVEASKRMVLIVDDEADARHDLEDKLKRLDYRVVSCESPSTAMTFLDTVRFDVCLLDLDMPEMNGLEMIQQIRQSKSSSNASVIVVSGSPEKFVAADAIERGADDYLEKPADERLLRARIQSCLRQSDAWRIELSKFLPPDVLDRVITNKQLLDDPMPADVSVLVCDIRGFSRVSERIGPVQTIRWISDVMNRLSRIILHRGGTIIDYVGDEIMAMWGAPIPSQHHATDACLCALAIQDAARELSDRWRDVINADFEIGIGVNSGLAVVGNTGSKHRIKYGPLGDTVNLASRVQGATKYLHSAVLITQSTASRIEKRLCGRRISTVRVQNIHEPVQLFELASSHHILTQQEHSLYERALYAFETERLAEALGLLAELLVKRPEDGPAKLLMVRVIQAQLGGSTDPILTLPGK